MKIAVIGETWTPVTSTGSGGLGRMTYEHANELHNRGLDITLYSPKGGDFKGKMIESDDVQWKNFDVILDCSHEHKLSKQVHGIPALNLLGDRQCRYNPPNAVVESNYMLKHYPTAKLISAGIDSNNIPFSNNHEDYLVFMGLNVGHKQPKVAEEVANMAGKDLIFIGNGFKEFDEGEKWIILGKALGLICPYTIDSSPRSPLEAAVCGTPTICLDGDGTKDHVIQNVTGFICINKNEMADHVKDLRGLNPQTMHDWAIENHDIKNVMNHTISFMEEIVKGNRW
jgi:hypothetical protein